MSDYTPSLDGVRADYIIFLNEHEGEHRDHAAAFDRMIAQVRAEALREAADAVAGAGALDRLADPVSLGRIAWEAVHDHGAFARDFPDEAYYRAVGEAIAHGETNDGRE